MKSDLITVYTIGHGRHPWKDFLALLNKHEIKFLCDVRNFARSRWVQFKGAVLSENLRENGIGYEHLPECGGRLIAKPEDLAIGTAPTQRGDLVMDLVVEAIERVGPETFIYGMPSRQDHPRALGATPGEWPPGEIIVRVAGQAAPSVGERLGVWAAHEKLHWFGADGRRLTD